MPTQSPARVASSSSTQVPPMRPWAAGMIGFSLRRADPNVHWQPTAITREDHAGLKKSDPARCCGSPACRAAGKSTIANEVEKALNLMNRHTFLARWRQCPPRPQPRSGVVYRGRPDREYPPGRRSGQADGGAGLIVLTAFISPFRGGAADGAPDMMAQGEFIEILRRHPAGRGRSARCEGGSTRRRARGQLKNFTGIDSPYEPPENAEIRVNTVDMTPEEAARYIIQQIPAAQK